jgi:hypothetical protein
MAEEKKGARHRERKAMLLLFFLEEVEINKEESQDGDDPLSLSLFSPLVLFFFGLFRSRTDNEEEHCIDRTALLCTTCPHRALKKSSHFFKGKQGKTRVF